MTDVSPSPTSTPTSTPTPAPADTTLWVPMKLEAMVLNQEARAAHSFLRFQMQYENLQQFESPEPAPFVGGSTEKPEAGIYLHWTLPKALRHGHRKGGRLSEKNPPPYEKPAQTSVEYPLVPNRWLVIRTQYEKAHPSISKAWIIESDFLDAKLGTSPYVDPHQTQPDGKPIPTKIGRAFRFTEELNPLPIQNRPFLKAIAPGNALFASYSPGVKNVFSFYDDMTDNTDQTALTQGNFTYQVIGWYSDPKHDPLHQAQWVPNHQPDFSGTYVCHLLDWVVYAKTPPAAQKMLVHALVSQVNWDLGADNPPAKHFPTDLKQHSKVAVGNNAIDALAAIIRLHKPNSPEADLLEAFRYDLLEHFDEPGSSERLNMDIRQHWFGTTPSGHVWSIVPQEHKDSALPPPDLPPLTQTDYQTLANLNTQQSEWDRNRRLLQSMQQKLYGLWWKYKRVTHQSLEFPVPVSNEFAAWLKTQLARQIGIAADPSEPNWWIHQVRAQQAQVDTQAKALKQLAEPFQASLHQRGYELKATSTPQYYYPNDPVILATGLGRSTHLDPTGPLVCRLPSQTLTALTVNGTTYTTQGTGKNSIQSHIPVLSDPNHLLPESLQALYDESFLLSPQWFAITVLQDATQSDEVNQAIQALPTTGAQFPPLELARQVWAQPWVPLLLDWQVTVLEGPAYTGESNQTSLTTFHQEDWKFTGTDFQWNGSKDANDFEEEGMVLKGRTFITPHLTLSLADQLQEFVEKHKDRGSKWEALLKDLETTLEALKKSDSLSQRLSGMTAQMIQRNYAGTPIPSGDITSDIGSGHLGHPQPYPHKPHPFAPAIFDFAPMRGTFFIINRLSVIDMFGRTVDLLEANYNPSLQTEGRVSEDGFYPIPASNLQTHFTQFPSPTVGVSAQPAQRMLQLTPRLIQDAQLSIQFTPNTGASEDVSHLPQANPICGWLLPNHLNRSLAVYAPDGEAWGELYLSVHETSTQPATTQLVPAWQPDPTNPHAPTGVDKIPNMIVQRMLTTLMHRQDNGVALSDFLQVIDETLWTVNPRGGRHDQNLSVLVGRPLAIVRMKVSLKIPGRFTVNQDWWNTFAVQPNQLPDPQKVASFQHITGGVPKFLWPVLLGNLVFRDDGLIGYFVTDPNDAQKTFETFNTLTLPSSVQTDYLKKIDADHNHLQLSFIDDTCTAPDPKQHQVVELTALVDPRGSVHAFTGLLPVTSVTLPERIVTPALQKINYLFRSGPFLTSPDAVRTPRPAENKGQWSWFDEVTRQAFPLEAADGKVRFPSTPPLIKEGWLKFKPNPPHKK